MVKGKRELAVRGKHEVAAGGYAADAGAGFERAQTSDFAITRLMWLQDLSPQTKAKNAKHVAGAEPGMIYDPVAGKLYTKLRVVPFHYRRTYLEWIPREKDGTGGGFVAEHAEVSSKWEKLPRGPYIIDRKLTADKKEHEVNEAREFGVLFVGDEVGGEAMELEGELPVNARPALITLAASQLRRAANWYTVMNGKLTTTPRGRQPLPLFANVFDVELGDQVNKAGQQFYGWEFTDVGVLVPHDHELYQRGRALHQQMLAGTLAAPPHEQDGVAEPDTDGRM